MTISLLPVAPLILWFVMALSMSKCGQDSKFPVYSRLVYVYVARLYFHRRVGPDHLSESCGDV